MGIFAYIQITQIYNSDIGVPSPVVWQYSAILLSCIKGMGLLYQFFSVPTLPGLPELSIHYLPNVYHVYMQLHDTCQIWMWVNGFHRCIYKRNNIPRREVSERSFINTFPMFTSFRCRTHLPNIESLVNRIGSLMTHHYHVGIIQVICINYICRKASRPLTFSQWRSLGFLYIFICNIWKLSATVILFYLLAFGIQVGCNEGQTEKHPTLCEIMTHDQCPMLFTCAERRKLCFHLCRLVLAVCLLAMFHLTLCMQFFSGEPCLLAILRTNGWTAFYQIFRADRIWHKEQLEIFWGCCI